MNDSRVGRRSWWERMKIFEVVIGSNHRFIQPQTVGKKAGAPIICFQPLALVSRSIRGMGRYSQRFGPGFPGNEQ
jgi:hypothetical protein